MGVYIKIGEDKYQQLDSRRNGHILHLQSKISFQNKFQFLQWQIEKPFSIDPNCAMKKWASPENKSLFSRTRWMFISNKKGNLIEDENCKVDQFSPLISVHKQCSKITIKTTSRLADYFEGVYSCGDVYSEYSAGRMVFTLIHTERHRKMYMFVNPETGDWEVFFYALLKCFS